MNDLTREWVDKAEGDFATARRELRARRLPNYDAACFHAQQCAEKYLKAFLQEHGAGIPKTHNLVDLLDLALRLDVHLEPWRNSLVALSPYGVLYRYPGEAASKTEATTALRAVTPFRGFMRDRLGLPRDSG
jgi:HEPN domain-containing protein